MESQQKNLSVLEILAVLLTGIGKIVFINLLPYRLAFIIAVCGFWSLYVLFRWSRNKDILRHWGLNTDRFRNSFLQLLPYAGVLILGFLLFGFLTNNSVLDWTIVLILLLYPIWGILQQFLLLGIFGQNLRQLTKGRLPEVVVVVITAVLFAIIHYPEPLLIGGTFLLAIVYMYLYLRGTNLIALGIYHGWLAAFVFYCVMGRNSWQEAFGNVF